MFFRPRLSPARMAVRTTGKQRVAKEAPMMTATVPPTRTDLAEVLFASTLQASETPTAAQVRAVIEQGLRVWENDCTACAACVAQEAGDHPDVFARRMHWALQMVETVYGSTAG
jgi:hypothetical protein